MEEKALEEYILLKLIRKYPDKDQQDLKDAIEDCIAMFKRLTNDLEKSTFTKTDANWIKRACIEVIQRTDDGFLGVKEYQEQNVRYVFQRENISRSLVLELFPKVGTIK